MELRKFDCNVCGLGQLNRNEHSVFCITNNTLYPSSKIAAAVLGIDAEGISMCLCGKLKSFHGYEFSRPPMGLAELLPYIEDAAKRQEERNNRKELLRNHYNMVHRRRLEKKLRRLTEQRDELLCKQSAVLNEFAGAIANIDTEIKDLTAKIAAL